MAVLFLTPGWFFTYSIGLEFLFGIITLLVAVYAFKIYKLSEEKQLRTFGIGFLLISLSYFILGIVNLLIAVGFDDDVSRFMGLKAVYLFNLFGSYFHALIYILGLVFLTYSTLKIDNNRVLALLTAICVVSVYFSPYKVFMFYLLSTVLLLFTVIYYFMNYLKSRRSNTFIVLVAMIFLLFGTMHLIFAVEHALYYVLGHVLEAIAYVLILISLLRIVKHGKEKR